MRTSGAIFKDVEERIFTEMMATADFRRTRSSRADGQVLEARADLLSLLHEAAGLRDINLLLDIERAYMRHELNHIAHAKKNIASLNAGIRQIEAALAMLDYVRDPDVYQWAGVFYALSEELVHGLPKDAAHKFFVSHGTRLGNVETGPLEESQTALLEVRGDNVRLARKLYIELQEDALAASEARSPLPEVREPAKPYAPERKHRMAA